MGNRLAADDGAARDSRTEICAQVSPPATSVDRGLSCRHRGGDRRRGSEAHSHARSRRQLAPSDLLDCSAAAGVAWRPQRRALRDGVECGSRALSVSRCLFGRRRCSVGSGVLPSRGRHYPAGESHATRSRSTSSRSCRASPSASAPRRRFGMPTTICGSLPTPPAMISRNRSAWSSASRSCLSAATAGSTPRDAATSNSRSTEPPGWRRCCAAGQGELARAPGVFGCGVLPHRSFAGCPPEALLRCAASRKANSSSVSSFGTGGTRVSKNFTTSRSIGV